MSREKDFCEIVEKYVKKWKGEKIIKTHTKWGMKESLPKHCKVSKEDQVKINKFFN